MFSKPPADNKPLPVIHPIPKSTLPVRFHSFQKEKASQASQSTIIIQEDEFELNIDYSIIRKSLIRPICDDLQAKVNLNLLKTLSDSDIKLLHLDTMLTTSGRRIPVTAYTSVSLPSMTIESYFRRLVDFINVSYNSMIGMLILLERYIKAPQYNSREELLPSDWIDEYNIHRLILITLMIAHKYSDDHVYDNSVFANVGGVSVKELRSLEVDFLKVINYNTFIKNEEFREKFNSVAPTKSSSSFLPLCSFFQAAKQREEKEEFSIYSKVNTPLPEKIREWMLAKRKLGC